MSELDDDKVYLKNLVKKLTREALAVDDWKTIRHYEQVSAGIATTLSEAQFEQLLSDRKAWRDWSDAKEVEIDACETREQASAVILART